MSKSPFPDGLQCQTLDRKHHRKRFASGQSAVDSWLQTKALQHQEKHLSVTKVLAKVTGEIAGYYTLATNQVEFGDLPAEIAKGLPKRAMPVAVLAWLGVAKDRQRTGLGRMLLALALRDCYYAGMVLPFVAVTIDCVDDAAKSFYRQFDFTELPGRPYRLYVSTGDLRAIVETV